MLTLGVWLDKSQMDRDWKGVLIGPTTKQVTTHRGIGEGGQRPRTTCDANHPPSARMSRHTMHIARRHPMILVSFSGLLEGITLLTLVIS